MALVTGILVRDLHDTDVGIRNRVILNDSLVISPTAEHLAVARIGERLIVEDLHKAVLVPVAEQIAIRGYMAPYERHERLSASLWGWFPILGFQCLRILDETWIGNKGRIGSGKDFLPTQAVESNHYHLRILIRFGA